MPLDINQYTTAGACTYIYETDQSVDNVICYFIVIYNNEAHSPTIHASFKDNDFSLIRLTDVSYKSQAVTRSYLYHSFYYCTFVVTLLLS